MPRILLTALASAVLLTIGCTQADQAAGQGRSSTPNPPPEIKALMDERGATQDLLAALKDLRLCQQEYGIGAAYISALAVLGGSRSPLNDLRAFETNLQKVSMPAESGKGPSQPLCEASLFDGLGWHDSALEMIARILVAAGRGQDALPVLSELKKPSRSADAAELYAELGERKLALAAAEPAQGKNRTEILEKIAVALIDRNDLTGAQEILAQVEEPARPPVQARISALQRNWTEAWKLTQRVDASDQSEIARWLSTLLAKKGAGPEAAQVARAMLASQKGSPDSELVALLARNGQLEEALTFTGPKVETVGYRLNCVLAVVPELLKAGRADELGKLTAQAKELAGKDTYVQAAKVLKAAGLGQEADAVVQQAVADSERGDRFERFLAKTYLASSLRGTSFSPVIPGLLAGAKDLVSDPGRCNSLTGLSYQYAAIGRYKEAAEMVEQCSERGNQSWRVLAHALTLIEYARTINPSFRERFKLWDLTLTLKFQFQLSDIYGAMY